MACCKKKLLECSCSRHALRPAQSAGATWGRRETQHISPALHCGSRICMGHSPLSDSLTQSGLRSTASANIPWKSATDRTCWQSPRTTILCQPVRKWSMRMFQQKYCRGSSERDIIPYPSFQEKVNKFSQTVKNHFNYTTEGQELMQGLIKLPACGQHCLTLQTDFENTFPPNDRILSSPFDCFLIVHISKLSFCLPLHISFHSLHYVTSSLPLSPEKGLSGSLLQNDTSSEHLSDQTRHKGNHSGPPLLCKSPHSLHPNRQLRRKSLTLGYSKTYSL